MPDETVRQLLHRGDRRQGRRGPRTGPAAAADGRRRTPADASRSGSPATSGTASRASTRVLPKGTLLGAHGPGSEALDPGDARRGQLRAVPVLLRRDRLERAAAVQRPGRSHRRHAPAQVRAGAAAAASRPRHGCRAPPSAGVADRRRHLRVRVGGLAALAARREVAGALPLAHDPRHRSRTRWPRSTSCSCPTATRRRRTTTSARAVARRCAPGSPTAAGSSPGVAAPSWPR